MALDSNLTMKTVTYASLISLFTAANALGHSTGLPHAHPHSENSSYFTAFAAIAIAVGLGWMAIRHSKRVVSRVRTRK